MNPTSRVESVARPATAGLILLLGSLTAIGPASIDMYLPSLPNIGTDLGAATSEVQLTLAVYFIGMALGQLIYGPLSDRLGRKMPMLVGLGLFTLASAGCAFAPNIGSLIAFRFLQAMGGCAAMVISRAIVRDVFPVQDAARVFSLMTLVMGVAPILAPMAGAGLLATSGWRAIFTAIAAFGAIALVAAGLNLPETRSAATRRAQPPNSLADDLKHLLKDPRFLGFSLAGGMAQAGMFAYISGSPFVLIELHHVPATTYSWIFGLNALGLITASQLNGWLLKTQNPRQLLNWTVLAPAVFGLSLAATAWTGFGGLWGLLLPIFGFVASLGFVFPNATASALEAHGQRAGFASALMGSLQFAIAAVASGMIGRLHDGSALPLAMVMATSGVFAFLAHRLLAERKAEVRLGAA
ncbi:Bicyclomycin resistance protein [compost metagenome]